MSRGGWPSVRRPPPRLPQWRPPPPSPPIPTGAPASPARRVSGGSAPGGAPTGPLTACGASVRPRSVAAELDERFVIRTAEDGPRARQHEGRDHEARAAARLHPRGTAARGAAGAGHAPGRRAADGPEPGRGGRPRGAGRRSGALLPRLGPGTGGGGERRPGPPGRARRRPRRGGEGAVPGRRPGDPGRPRQRRGALRPVLGVRPQGPRRQGARRRAAATMGDELDYRIEAANQAEFVERYRGHPFIPCPPWSRSCSTQRC